MINGSTKEEKSKNNKQNCNANSINESTFDSIAGQCAVKDVMIIETLKVIEEEDRDKSIILSEERDDANNESTEYSSEYNNFFEDEEYEINLDKITKIIES